MNAIIQSLKEKTVSELIVDFLLVATALLVLSVPAYLIAKEMSIVEKKPFTAKFELVHVNPPKYMRVDLKNVDNGTVHENVRVGKYCRNYKDNTVIGGIYTLNAQTLVFDDNTTSVRFLDLKDTFCK